MRETPWALGILLITVHATQAGPFEKIKSCNVPTKQMTEIQGLIEKFMNTNKTEEAAEEVIAQVESDSYYAKPDECHTILGDVRKRTTKIINDIVKLQKSTTQDRAELKKTIETEKKDLLKQLEELQEGEKKLIKELEYLKKQSESNTLVKAAYQIVLGKVEEGYQTFLTVKDLNKASLVVYQAYKPRSIAYILQFLEKMPSQQIEGCTALFYQILLNDDAQNPMAFHLHYYAHKFKAAGVNIDTNLYRTSLRTAISAKLKEVSYELSSPTYQSLMQYENSFPGFFSLYLEELIEISMENNRDAGHNMLDLAHQLSPEVQLRIYARMFLETKTGNQDYANMLSLPPRLGYMIKHFINTPEYDNLDVQLKNKLQEAQQNLLIDRFMSNITGKVNFIWPMDNEVKANLSVSTKKQENGQPRIYLNNPAVDNNEWAPHHSVWNIKTINNGRTFVLEADTPDLKYLTIDKNGLLMMSEDIVEGSHWWFLDYPHNGRLNPAKDNYSGKTFLCTLYNKQQFWNRLVLPGDEWPRPPNDLLRVQFVDDTTWKYLPLYTTDITSYWEVVVVE